MTPSTTRASEISPTGDVLASLRVGHLYLDARARRLHCLNEEAKRLHEDGIPLLGTEPTLAYLRTAEGEAVRADDLPLVAAARLGQEVTAGFVLAPPGGPTRHLLWNATPLKDATGQILAVIATLCSGPPPPDWDTLAGLAHDLRSPLQALRFVLAALSPATAPPGHTTELLERLRAVAERALQIGSDLLDWCRFPSQGGRRVELAWLPLEPFLASLVEEQALAAEAKGLTLGTALTEVEGWEAYTDRVRLARVLMNLLLNAIRYTRPGGRVALTAQWQQPDGERELALSVIDTGAGIAPEEQESIFQPFERGKSGRGGDSTGSGLGLAVVDQLVHELGLRREIVSEYGRGSTFRVLLPPRLLRYNPILPGEETDGTAARPAD
jgi:hypothetical protein